MSQDLVNAAVLGSIYVLFALGLTLSWGVLNILNLAHGAIFMSGGLMAWKVSQSVDLPFPLLVLTSAVGCGLLAVVLERAVYRPIRQRFKDAEKAELSTLVAAVAAAAIPVAIAAQLTDNRPVGISEDAFTVTSYTVAGVRVTNSGLIIIALALVLGLSLTWFVKNARQGRALRALAFDPYACGLLGISESRMASATMFVSGALAGVAGVLLAVQQSSVSAEMGESYLLKGFAVIILGGVGSLGGAMVGAYALAVIETLTIVYLGGDFKEAVAFILIIVLLLVRPQGIFSREVWQRA
jgi:branched-chain amino acid transport system permease protein